MSPMRMRSGQPVSATDSNAMETPKNTLVFFILLLRTGANECGRAKWTWPHEPNQPTARPYLFFDTWNGIKDARKIVRRRKFEVRSSKSEAHSSKFEAHSSKFEVRSPKSG